MSHSPFFPPFTSLKMLAKVLHPSPDPGRVRQSVCQRLFKDYLRTADKSKPGRAIILLLTWAKGLLVDANQLMFRCSFWCLIENACSRFDFSGRLFLFNAFLNIWTYSESLLYLIACPSDPGLYVCLKVLFGKWGFNCISEIAVKVTNLGFTYGNLIWID